jgi:hypothetical protein
MATRGCFLDGDEQRLGTTGTLNVHFNKFSIGDGHSLLAPPDHREELRMDDLVSAVEFGREGPGLVFHNMRGAGASKPEHLHFHAFLRDGALPIEGAPRSVQLLKAGITVARVEQYPAYALALRGSRRAQVAFTILSALRPTPYNLLISPDEVIVVPRAQERPSTFDNAFGALEMGGCLVLSDQGRYGAVTYREIWDAIRECGWTADAGRAFERRLALDPMLMEDGVAPAAAALPELYLG